MRMKSKITFIISTIVILGSFLIQTENRHELSFFISLLFFIQSVYSSVIISDSYYEFISFMKNIESAKEFEDTYFELDEISRRHYLIFCFCILFWNLTKPIDMNTDNLLYSFIVAIIFNIYRMIKIIRLKNPFTEESKLSKL